MKIIAVKNEGSKREKKREEGSKKPKMEDKERKEEEEEEKSKSRGKWMTRRGWGQKEGKQERR